MAAAGAAGLPKALKAPVSGCTAAPIAGMTGFGASGAIGKGEFVTAGAGSAGFGACGMEANIPPEEGGAA